MRRIAIAVLSLMLGDAAIAAERAPQKPAPECLPLAKLKETLKGARFTPLNIGQFNFVLGAYDARTPSNTPLPAADNAILVSKQDKSMIVWLKAECVAHTPFMPIGPEFAAHIRAIHPTAGESSDAPADSKDELSL